MFHSSVAAVAPVEYPPNPKPAVCVPELPKNLLAVAIVAGEVVQLVPFHNSVAPVLGGVVPPNAKAAV
jgi:hypothetical protein